MFFAGVGVALVFEGAQGGDELGAGLRGLDDGVDVAALGGDVGIGEALAEIVDFFAAQLFAVGFGGAVDFALVDDIDRAFRAHHGDFRGGPGEIDVGADVLGGHDAIRAAIGFARDHRDFRDGGFGEGEEQLRAVLDDAANSCCVPGRKPGTSSNVMSGILNASQKRTKRAPFTEALMSSTPARNAG